MGESKVSTFEVILLIVGVAASFLGFQLINQAYTAEKQITWMTLIAIFDWLMLLVLFILLSLTVDTSKKQLAEIRNLADSLTKKKGRR
ncbi:hypothetical protein HYW19_03170 [Candidatus Woesearchaeota archaeon]|nr:hypothetical protein [Candidatus Woesearchaeota archaeon]